MTTEFAIDILPSQGMLPDDRPETAVAGLPTTLIVAGLETQLASAASGYTQTDYLSPILDAAALIRERRSGDAASLEALDASIRQILGRVATAIEQEWGIDLNQLGLDASGGDYASDVLELYRFFVTERVRLGRDLLAQVILSARKRLVERYRKSVEKRNQTVAEARRVFQTFEDVVVWVSIPQILEDLRDEGNWGFDMADSLILLESDGATFLSRLAALWGDDDFAAKYCVPALSDENISGTGMVLQDRWMSESPKKTEPSEEPAE